MKKTRKSIAIILVLMLTVTTSQTAVAQDNISMKQEQDIEVESLLSEDSLGYDNCKEEIGSDLEALEECGVLGAGDLKEITAQEHGNIDYEIQIGEYLNKITVLQNTDDIFEMEVVQDDIMENVRVTSDGRIFADGNEVIISETEEDNIVIGYDSEQWYQKKCPYGTKADYSKYFGTTKNADIRFTKTLQDITMSLYITALTSACGGKTVAQLIASDTYTALRNYEPQSKGISYVMKKYYHKNHTGGGYIKAIKQYVYKCNYTWYPKANYKGKTKAVTLYHVKQLY